MHESTNSWLEALRNLKHRGTNGPLVAVDDRVLVFWNALNQLYPEIRHQHFWVQKTANVLNRPPKSVHFLALH